MLHLFLFSFSDTRFCRVPILFFVFLLWCSLSSAQSIDPDFTGTGADDRVYTMVLQGNGKILIGGIFNQYNGTARYHIARVNADGSLDTDFNPGSGANDIVVNVTVQTDGKALIGGYFTQYNGITRNRI